MSVVKRQKTDPTSASNGSALVSAMSNGSNPSHPSSIQLSGHEAEVLAIEFDGSGQNLASCSADKTIALWDIRTYANYGVISGHKGAVLDIKWSRDSTQLHSASSDMTVATWDVESGTRIKKHLGHEDMVNSLDTTSRGTEYIVSGSDDGSIGLWDPREREAVTYIQTEYPILAVAIDSIGAQVFSGGVDSKIHAWDIRNSQVPLYSLKGHGDGLVTSIKVSPSDEQLATNGSDNAVRTWDIKSFTTNQSRELTVLDGAPASVEQQLLRIQWSPDGKRIGAGSGDRTAVIWDVFTRSILSKLPGHLGSVNDVAFSTELFATASSDKTIFVGPV